MSLILIMIALYGYNGFLVSLSSLGMVIDWFLGSGSLPGLQESGVSDHDLVSCAR